MNSCFFFCFCAFFLTHSLTLGHVERRIPSHEEESSVMQQVLERLAVLEERDVQQQKLITTLQNELTTRASVQDTVIAKLRNEVTSQKREIGLLKYSMLLKDNLNEKPCSCRTSRKTERSFHNPVSQDQGLEGGRISRSRRLENDVTVAFSAGLSKTLTQPGINQNIVFDHVEINAGNGYNPHHGIFVAPVSGIYVFYTAIYATHAYGHAAIYCHFSVNGVAKSTLYAESNTASSDTGSQMLITKLNKGDDVALQLISGASAIYGNAQLFSTFSGFLLQQDFAQPSNIVG